MLRSLVAQAKNDVAHNARSDVSAKAEMMLFVLLTVMQCLPITWRSQTSLALAASLPKVTSLAVRQTSFKKARKSVLFCGPPERNRGLLRSLVAQAKNDVAHNARSDVSAKAEMMLFVLLTVMQCLPITWRSQTSLALAASLPKVTSLAVRQTSFKKARKSVLFCGPPERNRTPIPRTGILCIIRYTTGGNDLALLLYCFPFKK